MDIAKVDAMIQEYDESGDTDYHSPRTWESFTDVYNTEDFTTTDQLKNSSHVCTHSQHSYSLVGLILEGVIVLLLFLLIYYFAFKTKCKPKVHLWLAWACFCFACWMVGQMIGDNVISPYTCYFSENIILFGLFLGSLIQIGISTDRLISVYSKKTGGGLSLSQINKSILCMILITLLIVILNVIELNIGTLDDEINKYISGCASASTYETNTTKLWFKGLFYLFCCFITVVLTIVTVFKILKTKIRRKKKILLNLICVTLATCFAWISASIVNLTKLNHSKPLCPSASLGRLGHHLLGIPVLLVFAFHMFFSWHLRNPILLQEQSTPKSKVR